MCIGNDWQRNRIKEYRGGLEYVEWRSSKYLYTTRFIVDGGITSVISRS